MHTSFISVLLLKLLRESMVSWLDIVCPCHWLSTPPATLRSSLAPKCSGLALQFCGIALTVSCIHLVIVSLFFRRNCCAWCAWGCWNRRFHLTPVCWPLLFQAPKRFQLGGGLHGYLPPHARALPSSSNFVGTNAQVHLLVMSLNVENRTN